MNGAPVDEVTRFCLRVAGPERARAAAALARRPAGGDRDGGGRGDRLAALAAASRGCRAVTETEAASVAGRPAAREQSLAAAVAAELVGPVLALPERQREVLALREACALDYAEIALVMGLGAPAAVGPLLVRARLRLRAERRGELPGDGCPEREDVLVRLGRRADGEAIDPAELARARAHLAEHEGCALAAAAMWEAATVYRAWAAELLVAEPAPAVEPEREPEPASADAPPGDAPAGDAPAGDAPPGDAPAARQPWYRRLRSVIVEDARR